MDLFALSRTISLNKADEEDAAKASGDGKKKKKITHKKSDSDIKEEEEKRRTIRAALMIQSAWRFKKMKDAGGKVFYSHISCPSSCVLRYTRWLP